MKTNTKLKEAIRLFDVKTIDKDSLKIVQDKLEKIKGITQEEQENADTVKFNEALELYRVYKDIYEMVAKGLIEIDDSDLFNPKIKAKIDDEPKPSSTVTPAPKKKSNKTLFAVSLFGFTTFVVVGILLSSGTMTSIIPKSTLIAPANKSEVVETPARNQDCSDCIDLTAKLNDDVAKAQDKAKADAQAVIDAKNKEDKAKAQVEADKAKIEADKAQHIAERAKSDRNYYINFPVPAQMVQKLKGNTLAKEMYDTFRTQGADHQQAMRLLSVCYYVQDTPDFYNAQYSQMTGNTGVCKVNVANVDRYSIPASKLSVVSTNSKIAWDIYKSTVGKDPLSANAWVKLQRLGYRLEYINYDDNVDW